jgi:HSP20 family protein
MSTHNPFEEIEQFFARMRRQFERAPEMWGPEGPLGRYTSGLEPMAIDLVEHDEEFVVVVDLPGFDREDVGIQVTDHTLRIEAEREEHLDEEEERYLHHERRHRSSRRSIQLPGEVDTEAVSARMRNGVVTITLPKLEAEEAREIDVEIE